MAVKGRKRKAGPRYPSGDLIPARDMGTPELTLQRARGCGQLTERGLRDWTAGKLDEALKTIANPVGQGVDAVGRAYVAGLLDHPTINGAALRDAGRVLYQLYWSHYSKLGGTSTSALYRAMVSQGVVASAAATDPERQNALERALNRRLAAIALHGRECRAAVESLCIDPHLDAGPMWLDRLIAAKASNALVDTADWARMRLAVRGLAEIA